ncbi:ABC transporter substrate-binding protein [Rhodospirillum centenum]|uniref:Periplasmic binding protein, putative n=1 Tax=Rhodospirillum centenum (strain ATCC 51521 / SW) TaxID=414684 RepID=B6IQM5_RHOCS|nr:ABC transporter substrate-binding protein [Rhodospirillum centenum]ACI97761.1 periplasmic binding protein, putative [Rhodospirillum centenum SW]
MFRLLPRLLPAALLLLPVLLFPPAAVAQEAPPRRIVSMNLCADQFLVDLADRDQVLALSEYARDPILSSIAERARSWPVGRGTAEEVLALKPDLIIASRLRRQETRALLAGFQIKVLELGTARTFEEIVAQARTIAAAVGHPERGEALVARMRAVLDALPAPAETRPVAVHYQRRGFVSGGETLMDEIMGRAGLVNMARSLDGAFVVRVPLERIVTTAPEYLLLTTAPVESPDLGSDMLEHPVLSGLYGPERRLELPEAVAMCGGPAYPEAVASLMAQLGRGRAAPTP